MSIIESRPAGLYCSAGDFYVDPWGAVSRAVITHAHGDHARLGSAKYLAHPLTANLMRERLGPELSIESIAHGVPLQIGRANVSFHPAGHVPGSSQIRIEAGGKVCVVSGDYKLEDDRVSEPFEPLRCHTFITESTFGLPIFRWRPQHEIFAEMHQWWSANAEAGVTSVLFAYSLGKTQRILAHLNEEIGPIYLHPSAYRLTEIIARAGAHFPAHRPLDGSVDTTSIRSALVLAPQVVQGSRWVERLAPYAIASASGWMDVRGMRRRRGIEKGFVLSDHADFEGLNRAVRETGAEEVLVTHGYSGVFAHWLREQGLHAEEIRTEFADDEDAERDGVVGASVVPAEDE